MASKKTTTNKQETTKIRHHAIKTEKSLKYQLKIILIH